jgi:hypothetical protein
MTHLPSPPPEVPCNQSMDNLAPGFRRALMRALDQMRQAGFDPVVYEATRTNERQAYLYGFGRDYDDGRGIVTNSDTAFTTWHFYGLAVDVVSRAQQWDAPAAFWRALEAAAEHEGLTSGADWDRNDATQSRLKDLPHVQWGPPMRRSPSPNAKALYEQAGVERVWHAVSAD